MSSRVLVAYATRYGSTAEIAEAIAARLREAGLTVDVTNVEDVRDLGGYGAVVLGAPVFLARMLRDGRRFLRRRHGELARVPFAAFLVGVDREDRRRGALDRQLAKRELHPFAVGMFGGVVDASRLRLRDKTPPVRKMGAFTDMRDWDAIASWAANVAAALQSGRAGLRAA
jgi:menaquinone-dependent protoporphyrinogen oxidase